MQDEGTRVANLRDVNHYDPSIPRLGRRESEPHAAEVSYLYDVLWTNFPEDRVTWDLHHYFTFEGEEIDIQFDISYFRGFKLPSPISSYRASEHQNRVPTLAINVLSKSTWRVDLSDTLDYCQLLKIPLYVVFSPYHVATRPYKPPFLRCYILQGDGTYQVQELRVITMKEQGTISPDAFLDVSIVVPFRLGLLERQVKLEHGLPLYRLIALHPTKPEVYLSQTGQARAEADKARAEVDKARAELDKARAEVDKYRKKYGTL